MNKLGKLEEKVRHNSVVRSAYSRNEFLNLFIRANGIS